MKKIIKIFLINYLLLHLIYGSAIFKLQLIEFGIYDTKKCDIITSCDPIINIRIESTDNSTQVIYNKKSNTFLNQNKIFFQNGDNHGIPNIIDNKLFFKPKFISIKINIKDNDLFNDEDIDHYNYEIYKINYNNNYNPNNNIDHKFFSPTSFFRISYNFYCNDNYYGNNCDIFCKQNNDDINGHYYCNQKGGVVCLDGWKEPENMCRKKKENCEKNKNKCLNGATCFDNNNNFTCFCPKGYHGKFCEEERDNCEPNPCVNSKKCETVKGDYKCYCKQGFTGKSCDLEVCKTNNHCENGGICYGNNNCLCSESFYGNKCQYFLCNKTGCNNNGLCTINGKCKCNEGYVGLDCGVNICDYIKDACKNGGKCFAGKCHCDPKYEGKYCQETKLCNYNINYCQNNSTCYNFYNIKKKKTESSCLCINGFYGDQCQYKIEEKSLIIEKKTGKFSTNYLIIGFYVCIVIIIILIIINIILIIKNQRNKNKYLKIYKKQKIFSTSSLDSSLPTTPISTISKLKLSDNKENRDVLEKKKSLSLLGIDNIAISSTQNIYEEKMNDIFDKNNENKDEKFDKNHVYVYDCLDDVN